MITAVVKRIGFLAGLSLWLGGSALSAWAQESYNGPTIVAPAPPPANATPPAPAEPPPKPVPATATPAPATAPTAENVLQDLLHPGPAAVIPGSGSPILSTPVSAVKQPGAIRLREGEKVVARVGRLVKDDKTGQWMFAFEADGKEMKDPPMGLVPCRYLEAMERLSEDGKKGVKFKVSGEVTEYHDKNFLYVQFMQVVRDLNQF